MRTPRWFARYSPAATAPNDALPRSLPRRIAAGFFACAAPDSTSSRPSSAGRVPREPPRRNAFARSPAAVGARLLVVLAKILREPRGWRALLWRHGARARAAYRGRRYHQLWNDGARAVFGLAGADRHDLHHRPVVQRNHRRGSRRVVSSAPLALAGGRGERPPRRLRRLSVLAKRKSARVRRAPRARARLGGATVNGAAAAGLAIQLDGVRLRRRGAPLRPREPQADRTAQLPSGDGLSRCSIPSTSHCRRPTGKRERATEKAQRRRSRRKRGIHPRWRSIAGSPIYRPSTATSAGSTCVWFIDLRFYTPGRATQPFRYGACRDGPATPWRLVPP